MLYEPRQNLGRPPVPDEKVKEVEQLARDGVTPKEAIQQTGMKQTKVYEIYRIVRMGVATSQEG